MSLITIDFETFYAKDFSLSKMTTESYLRDKRFEVIGVCTRVDDGEITWVTGDAVEPHLRSLDIPSHNLLAHNMAFDGAILSWRYGIKPKYYFDTLSLARPLQNNIKGGLSLANLARHFCLGEKGDEVVRAMGKRLADFTPQELAAYGEYCKTDTLLTYLLFHVLKQYSTKQEMYVIDLMLRMYTDPTLLLDVPQLRAHLIGVKARKAALMQKLRKAFNVPDEARDEVGRDVLMSNPQLAVVLEKLGVEPPMKVSPKTGKMTYAFSKNDEEFKDLLQHPDERVQTVVAARLGVKSTLEETRTETFIEIAHRGTLPIMLNYYGGHTGRASGGDGINPQNLTRGSPLRSAIYAPDGHNVVAGDSSQIEARILAWFAGEFELVSDFRQGVDIYSKFATNVYGELVTKADKQRRFLGKTCILGLGYMTGPAKLRKTLALGKDPVVIDEGEAKRIVNLYRDMYVMIRNLWTLADEALEYMAKGRECELGVHLKLPCTQEGIKLPNGMMLRYPNLRRTRDGMVYDTRRGPVNLYGGKMVENIIQSLARIVVFTQTCRLDQWLRTLDTNPRFRYKVVHSVHDEVVAVAPLQATQTVVTRMEELLSTPPKWCESLPVACEVGSGRSYGDCK